MPLKGRLNYRNFSDSRRFKKKISFLQFYRFHLFNKKKRMCDRDHRRIGYDLVLNQAKGKTMENMIFFLFRSSFMQFHKKSFLFFHVSLVQLVLPLDICSRMSPINRITRYVSICILVSKYLKTNLNAKFLKKNPQSG